jgi:hypothetical protein
VLMFFGARNNLIALVNILKKRSQRSKKKERLASNEEEGQGEDYEEEDNPFTNKLARIERANKEYIIITVLLYVVMIAASILLQDIELVFNFLGAVC